MKAILEGPWNSSFYTTGIFGMFEGKEKLLSWESECTQKKISDESQERNWGKDGVVLKSGEKGK